MSYKGIDNLKISAHNHNARLAEWSKALVLSANDRNVARVRIPHLANYFLSHVDQLLLRQANTILAQSK